MRRVISLTLIVAQLIALLSLPVFLAADAMPAAAQDDGESTAFTTQDGAFSFEYPAGWPAPNEQSLFIVAGSSETLPGEMADFEPTVLAIAASVRVEAE